MSFQITGLDAAPFRRFYGLSDDELQSLGVKRLIADASPGFPDRIELRDVEQGEALLLLNYLPSRPTRPTEQATPFSSANGPRRRIAPWTRFLTCCESARSRCAPSTPRATWSTPISSVETASSQRSNAFSPIPRLPTSMRITPSAAAMRRGSIGREAEGCGVAPARCVT